MMKKYAVGLLMLAGLSTPSVGSVSVTNVETWTAGGTAGWEAYDLINEAPVVNASSFSVSNNALRVSFKSYLDPRSGKPTLLPMPPEEYLLRAGPGASGGQFTGDYLAAGVAAVTFTVYCDAPVSLWLAFRNEATNRWWQLALDGLQTGVWQTVTIPIQPSLLQELGGAVDWASFEQDIRNVGWIGIIVRRHSALGRQTVMVDDFSLSGPGADFAAWMTRFSIPQGPAAVAERNSLPGADLDGDGVNNQGEWIAGTSAGDSNDCLRLVIEPGPGQRPRLKWNAKAGRSYRVWRCTDLLQGFSLVAPGIVPSSEEGVFEDSSVTGPVFYRLDVRTTP